MPLVASSTNRNCITPAGIQKRLQEIQTQNKILKVGGTVCLVLSVGAFITGATLMVLDFDGNDDEYYIEDGDIKTRMGMFDYGVIVIGVALMLSVFAVVFWGLLCFLPASNMASLHAAITASASTLELPSWTNGTSFSTPRLLPA